MIAADDNDNIDSEKFYELEKMADRYVVLAFVSFIRLKNYVFLIFSLRKAYQNLFLDKMSINAQMKLVNNFKAQKWNPSTEQAMRYLIYINNRLLLKLFHENFLLYFRREKAEMQRDSESNEITKNQLVLKMEEQAAELAKFDVEILIYESNKQRIGRAKSRIEHLNQFNDIVSNTMMASECIWILMQFDLERMKKRNDFNSNLDKYRMESIGCNKRIVKSLKYFYNNKKVFSSVFCLFS